jgi:hypothetical protein
MIHILSTLGIKVRWRLDTPRPSAARVPLGETQIVLTERHPQTRRVWLIVLYNFFTKSIDIAH